MADYDEYNIVRGRHSQTNAANGKRFVSNLIASHLCDAYASGICYVLPEVPVALRGSIQIQYCEGNPHALSITRPR